jgi:large subunit ribosomal protein L6
MSAAKSWHLSGKEEHEMSRIGRKPISVPAGVDVKIDGTTLTVKGPKGTLTKTFHKDMIIKQEGTELIVERPSEDKLHKSLHGLTRTLVSNMVEGVTNGFSKSLDIEGIGYRAAKQGKNLVMNLGYSHQVIVPEIDGITIDVPQPTKIIVNGIDKQAVGQFAAEIREKRPPEPYKGKGIRSTGERIIRKEGKAGKGKK